MKILFKPITAILILMLFAVGTSGYYYLEYQKSKNELKKMQINPANVQENQDQEIINKLGKLLVLPSGEKPTIATITNKEQLAVTQPFFKSAKNGDILIVYMQAKKAIIYDPITNKIIDIGPVVVTTPIPTPSLTLTPTPTPTFTPTSTPTSTPTPTP